MTYRARGDAPGHAESTKTVREVKNHCESTDQIEKDEGNGKDAFTEHLAENDGERCGLHIVDEAKMNHMVGNENKCKPPGEALQGVGGISSVADAFFRLAGSCDINSQSNVKSEGDKDEGCFNEWEERSQRMNQGNFMLKEVGADNGAGVCEQVVEEKDSQGKDSKEGMQSSQEKVAHDDVNLE